MFQLTRKKLNNTIIIDFNMLVSLFSNYHPQSVCESTPGTGSPCCKEVTFRKAVLEAGPKSSGDEAQEGRFSLAPGIKSSTAVPTA